MARSYGVSLHWGHPEAHPGSGSLWIPGGVGKAPHGTWGLWAWSEGTVRRLLCGPGLLPGLVPALAAGSGRPQLIWPSGSSGHRRQPCVGSGARLTEWLAHS